MEKKRADEAEKRVNEEMSRAEEAEKRANLAEENSIKLLVECSQELGASMDATVQSLMEKKSLSHDEALAKAELYWK